MTIEKKALAAAAAVISWIRSEEELYLLPPAAAQEVPAPCRPASFWRFSGRQLQMQAHANMLMKAYHRSKFNS